MSRGEVPPAGEAGSSQRELETRVSVLDAEVRRVWRELAEEIRTRRLVIVGDDGATRIELVARDTFGHVTVYNRAPGPGSTCAELFANDPADGNGGEVGLALTVAGDVVATLHVLGPGTPELWVERPTDADGE